MVNYLIKDTTLKSIGDSIRGHLIKLGNLSPFQMASEIRDNLCRKDVIKNSDIPEYVRDEVLRVANKVQSVRKDDSIIFLAMSDNHHYGSSNNGNSTPESMGTNTNTGNLHAAMAAKILAYALDIDFMAQLGDVTWGSSVTTSDLLHEQSDELVELLRDSHKDVPCFHAIGNHDTGIYYHNQRIEAGDTGVYTESGNWLYDNFTSLSASDDTVFGGTANGGYCYRDFADKKLRVFLLNTSEALVTNQSDSATLGSQRKWFADALVNLNSKSDASSWKFIVLSHYPADYGGTMPLSELLKAYVSGGSITIALESGSNTTVSFSGKNSAKMIAQFHGHIHNFLASKLYSYATGQGVQYNAWRVCIPNAQFNRENTYSVVGNYSDINFGEPCSYQKTYDTEKGTSFVVNVINPSDQVIHSICYGAGRDRIIGYGSTPYYPVYKKFYRSTLDNLSDSVRSGQSFTANIIPDTDTEVFDAQVIMGGVDVTATSYSGSRINIGSVTGDIILKIRSYRPLACTNWIPISTTSSGDIYNDVGYKADTYINNGEDRTDYGKFATGFIPIKNGDIVRLRNMSFTSGQPNHRIAFYNSSYGSIGHMAANGSYLMNTTLKGIMEDNNYVQFTMNTSHASSKNASFIRICCADISDESIVTVNEEPKYLDEMSETYYSISRNSMNIISSNPATTVVYGATYTNTLTAAPGYTIQRVQVISDGVDVTSTAYNNGVITIPSVTGTIEITAVATNNSATYTNKILNSIDTDGSVYNSFGFKENKYIISGTGDVGDRSGCYVTGFIPCVSGDTLYFKNVDIKTGDSNRRISLYDSNKNHMRTLDTRSTAFDWVYGEDGLLKSFKVPYSTTNTASAYVRVTAGYIGIDSIITVNQTIDVI